ncbi:hypothetical protein Hanom_Chr03g00263641 [Helianthus anomalus]
MRLNANNENMRGCDNTTNVAAQRLGSTPRGPMSETKPTRMPSQGTGYENIPAMDAYQAAAR